MLDRIQLTATASGSAGSATGSATTPNLVSGRVLKVHLDVSASPASTVDFALADDQDPASENIISLADQTADLALYPRRAVQDNAGSDVTFDGTNEIYEPYVVHGRLTLSIAQANDGDSVTATIWLDQ